MVLPFECILMDNTLYYLYYTHPHRSGIRVLPHNAKMHYNYANYLRDSSKSNEAINHYQEALDLWPTYASAHNNLGTLMKDQHIAEYHFLEAIKYSKEHINAHFNLGQLYR